MAKIQTPQPVRGTQDMFGETEERFAHVVSTFERVRRLYGFKGLQLPVIEPTAVFARSLGEATDAKMTDAFNRLAECQDEDPMLHIEARQIKARRRAGGVVWFDFKDLCGGPRSQNDYLEIASQFHTVLLSDVPHMPVNRASEARRFTWLIDVLYDRRVKLMMSAAVAPEALYTEGPMAHEFPRTVSRLNEMQSAEFLALERRTVDTRLT